MCLKKLGMIHSKYWLGFFVGFSLINSFALFSIEGATGFFTGSRYKDLQIQMYGECLKISFLKYKKSILKKSVLVSSAQDLYEFSCKGNLL